MEQRISIAIAARAAALAAAAAALAGGLAGCLKKPGFSCDRNDQCTGGTDGRCEANGYCSFSDDSCASGRRFGEHSGSVAGQCADETDGGIDAPSACPSTYQAIPGAATHVYHLITTPASWIVQNGACNGEGGYLVEPADAAELNAVTMFAGQIWVGITDQVTEGVYLTGRGAPVTFLIWDLGEPDDGPSPGGDCVRAQPGGTYADDRCGTLYRAVCECDP